MTSFGGAKYEITYSRDLKIFFCAAARFKKKLLRAAWEKALINRAALEAILAARIKIFK